MLPWEGFNQDANQLLLSLDNKDASYLAPTTSSLSGTEPIPPAADELDVRSEICSLTWSLDELAARIGITAEVVGAGSGRCSSSTNLVVRQAGRVTDPKHLSAIIWGVCQVQGNWQLSIKRGLELPSALRNKADIHSVLPSLQQVAQLASCFGAISFTLQQCCPLCVRKVFVLWT